jgi:hypothetical protein
MQKINRPAFSTGDPPPPPIEHPQRDYIVREGYQPMSSRGKTMKGIGKGGKRDEKKEGKEKGYMQKR